MAEKFDNKTPQTPSTEKPSYTHLLKADDIYALSLLQPLLANYPFLPFTQASLRPFCLAHIVNDIVINGRKTIIEFGSGISTIIIGRIIKKNSLNSTILSIENNKDWVKKMIEILKNEQIDDVVTVKWVPLKPCKLSMDSNQWYELKTLKEYTKSHKFDMLIVDGPSAWEPGKHTARYPAVPFMSNKLEKNFSIYLDDTNRLGEQQIIKAWEAEYGINFNLTGKSFAYYQGGKSFYTGL